MDAWRLDDASFGPHGALVREVIDYVRHPQADRDFGAAATMLRMTRIK